MSAQRPSVALHLERLIRAYRGSLLLSNVGAVDPEAAADRVSTGRGGHGSHKARTAPTFGAELPLSVELEHLIERLATVAERRLEDAKRGATGRPAQDKVGRAKRAEDAAILREQGRGATEVAYLYGRTTEGIRKLRQRSGLDPETGERLDRPRPLTAPARETFQHHESTTTTTEAS